MEQTDVVSNEYSSCSICLDPYKNPKRLPCLYSFCRKCLSVHFVSNVPRDTTMTLTCPVCQKDMEAVSPLSDKLNEYAEDFPNNFVILGLMDTLNTIGTKHSVESIQRSPSAQSEYCTKHSQNKCDAYCTLKKIGVCGECCSTEHKDCGSHHLNTEDAADVSSSKLRDFKNQMENFQKDVEKTSENFELSKPRELRLKKEELALKISEHFADLKSKFVKCLIQKEKDLAEQLTEIIEKEKQGAADSVNECSSLIKSFNGTVDLFDKLMTSSPINALTALCNMEEQMTSYATAVRDLQTSSERCAVEFVPCVTEIEQMMASVKIGEIQVQDDSVSVRIKDTEEQEDAGEEVVDQELDGDLAEEAQSVDAASGPCEAPAEKPRAIKDDVVDKQLVDQGPDEYHVEEDEPAAVPSAPPACQAPVEEPELVEDVVVDQGLDEHHGESTAVPSAPPACEEDAEEELYEEEGASAALSGAPVERPFCLEPPLEDAPPEYTPPEIPQEQIVSDFEVNLWKSKAFFGNISNSERRGGLVGITPISKYICAVVDRFNNGIKFISTRGKIVNTLTFGNMEPWDLTYDKVTNHIVITCPNQSFLVSVAEVSNRNTYFIEQTIQAKPYTSIAFLRGRAYVVGLCKPHDNPGVEIIDNMGNILSCINSQVQYPRSLECVGEGKIVVCDWTKKAVVVIESTGVNTTYHGVTGNELKDPMGLTKDRAGNVYILDRKMKKIHILNRKFGMCEVVVPLEGVPDPRMICIVDSSRSGQSLVVLDSQNGVHVYTLELIPLWLKEA